MAIALDGRRIELACVSGTWAVAPRMGTIAGSIPAMLVASGVQAARVGEYTAGFHNTYEVVARDRDGREKWREVIRNIVVTDGLNDVLTKYFKGSGYTAAWYVALKGTGNIVAGDTMASHGGWSEVTAYSEGARQTLTLGTAAAGSIDNSAAKAVFTVNANGTDVYGVFVCAHSTKGGTSGVLFGGANFGAARTGLQSGDTLTITITLTQATQ